MAKGKLVIAGVRVGEAGTNVWEILSRLLENEDAWGKGLPRDINHWQASQVLLALVIIGSPPKNRKRRLTLAVIENAAINSDGLEYRAVAAQAIRQLEGQELLLEAIDKERDVERLHNLRDLRDELIGQEQ